MKKTQLTATLQALSRCTSMEAANQLEALAAFIDRSPGATMAPILSRLEAGRKAQKIPMRSPAPLRSALVCLSNVVDNVGTKGAIGVINRLSKLLPPDVDCSLDDFLDDLDVLGKKPSSNKKAVARVANEPFAQELVGKLNQAKGDNSQFPNLMRTLENNKKVDTPTLRRIGELFLPRQKLAKGRKPVLDAILARHHDELRFAFQDGSLEALRD